MQMLATAPTDTVKNGAPTVLQVDVASRLDFLRKVYGLFTVGLGTASVGCVVAIVARDIVFSVSPFVLFIGYIAAFFGTMAVRKVPMVNIVALLGFTFLAGVMLAPAILGTLAAKGLEVGMANILTAFLGTTIAFGGLTAYVFISRKDFSYIGGFLAVGLFGLIGIMLCTYLLPMFGLSFGISPGMWIAINTFGLLLMCGFVLYDTSMIMRHYATDEYVMGALALFLDFILIFQYLLALLNSRD
ncbi:Bax inhibitor-1 family protein [Planctomycetota bacterium]|nr:Bax inhibitor-1 family protein [Planctomycetota bacterium]